MADCANDVVSYRHIDPPASRLVLDADEQDVQASCESFAHVRAREVAQAKTCGWLGRQEPTR
jgi:hypothetical protein